jgi:hypothetical protein
MKKKRRRRRSDVTLGEKGVVCLLEVDGQNGEASGGVRRSGTRMREEEGFSGRGAIVIMVQRTFRQGEGERRG